MRLKDVLLAVGDSRAKLSEMKPCPYVVAAFSDQPSEMAFALKATPYGADMVVVCDDGSLRAWRIEVTQ